MRASASTRHPGARQRRRPHRRRAHHAGKLARRHRYVLALGSYSPLHAEAAGLRMPVYPVKGYSITVPIIDAQRAPESTIMDETHKVAVTRLGERIRVGGTAELAGYSLALRERAPRHAEARGERPVPAGRRRWRAPSSGAACGR